MQDFIFICENRKCTRVFFAEVIYILSVNDGHFLKVATEKKNFVPKGSLRVVEKNLPPDQFCRVNLSTIVAINRVERFDYDNVYMGKDVFSFSDKYRGEFRRRITVLTDPPKTGKLIDLGLGEIKKEVQLS